MKSLSHVLLLVTPWTVAYKALLSMEFSRQEYWSGLPFPSPGDLPHPGTEPRSTTLQADALPSEPPGKPNYGGGTEDNGDHLQKFPCSAPSSRPPLTHTSATDSWTLIDKSGSVSCGVTAPFFWVLVHTKFCLCPLRVCFLNPV